MREFYMNDRERFNRWNEKEDLIDRAKSIMGTEPMGIRQLLSLLAHPDMIEHTIKFFNSLDEKHRCEIYDYPWSCAREAEAKYENLNFGWLGAGEGVGFDDSWCESCRRRVLDND